MGDAFGKGLLIACGCDAAHIDLKGRLGGDRPTALLAVAQLMRATNAITLTGCALNPEEGLRIAEGLRLSSCLTSLNLASNRLVGVWFGSGAFCGGYDASGLLAIASAVASSPCLTSLDLSQNSLGVAYVGGVRVNSTQALSALAEAVASSKSLKKLVLGYNSLGPNAARAIGEAAGRSTSLTELDISGNLVGLHGGKAIVDAVQANASLKVVDLRFNSLDAAVVGEAVGKLEGREGVRVEV